LRSLLPKGKAGGLSPKGDKAPSLKRLGAAGAAGGPPADA